MAKKQKKSVIETAGISDKSVDKELQPIEEATTEELELEEETTLLQEKSKGIFKDYPSVQELYYTSDELAFFERTDAYNHALSLNDKTINTVKRL